MVVVEVWTSLTATMLLVTTLRRTTRAAVETAWRQPRTRERRAVINRAPWSSLSSPLPLCCHCTRYVSLVPSVCSSGSRCKQAAFGCVNLFEPQQVVFGSTVLCISRLSHLGKQRICSELCRLSPPVPITSLSMPAARPPGDVAGPHSQSMPSSAPSRRHTAFADALATHPIFAAFLAPSAPLLPLSARLCVSANSSSLLFVLNPTGSLSFLNLAHLHAHSATPHVALTTTPPLSSASSALFLSSSSTYLAVTSPHSCCVVKLPRSLTSTSTSSPPSSPIDCRSYGVGPLTPTSSAFTLLHAAFHPLSSHHLLLLLSSSSHSSALHLYNLTADLDQPELVVPLPTSSSSSRAVSFCFAGKAGWNAWNVYVLYEDGHICTVCPLLPIGVAVQRAEVAVLREVEQTKVSSTGDEEARIRFRWLNEMFGSDLDSTNSELVVSHSSSLRPLAWSAMDMGSNVSRGESAVALLSLSTSAVQLARVYDGGRVDVLAGVSEAQPRFVEGPLARAAEVTLAAVDTVTLPASKLQCLLPLLPLSPASSTLTVLSRTAAHCLTFPYLAELAHVMSEPSLPPLALSTLLSRVQIQLSSTAPVDSVIAGCVLADIAFGRQLLLLTTEGVRVVPLSKKLTLADLRVASASSNNATGHQESFATRSTAAFSDVLAPYLSKYRNHRFDRAPIKQPLSLSSSAAFAAFLFTLPQFQSTITDLHTLHGEIATRTAVLAAVSDDTATTINTLCDSIELMREKQRLLRERLTVAAEIASETGKRVGRLIGEWGRRRAESGGGSLMSIAEREWRGDVEDREVETRKEQRREDEVAVRVTQLAALRDRRRALQVSERQLQGGDLQLGSVELGRLKAQLAGQTRFIEELIADIRDVRQQVRKREEANAWEEDMDADRTGTDDASKSRFTTPRLL